MNQLAYRIGFPCWKIAAKLGAPLKLRVDVCHDKDAGVFVATSNDLIGLVAEAETMDALVSEVHASINELLFEILHSKVENNPVTDLRLCNA